MPRSLGRDAAYGNHSIRRLLIGLVVALFLAGCSGSATSTPAPASVGPTAASPTPTPSVGRTPVIVDTDMGADDVMALLYLLREPSVDVRAVIVSGTGLAHGSNGAQVASDLLGALGASGIPLGLGSDTPMQGDRAFPDEWRSVADAGYGLSLPAVPMTPRPAVDLLSEAVRSSTTPVTVLTLGPLTDLGMALAAEPSLAAKVARVHVSGGAISVPGNVAAEGGDPAATAAEWNLWIDPTADDIVLRSGIPVTLVPLDATGKLPLTSAFFDALTEDHAAAGADIVYELLARSTSLLDGTFFWDQLATVLLADPAAASFAEATVRAVTDGPAAGSLVEDPSGSPVSYGVEPDASRFEASFLAGLRRGEPRTEPFTLAGTLHGTFDGVSCGGSPSAPIAPGTYAIDYESSVAAETLFAIVRLHDGATWQQMLDFVTAKGSDPTDLSPPDFVDLTASPSSSGPGVVRVIVDLTSGTYGLVCIEDAPLSIVPAPASFQVGD